MTNGHPISFLTLTKFKAKFGSGSKQRADLMRWFVNARTELYNYGAIRLFVAGSFITEKSAPSDIDLLIVLDDEFDAKGIIKLQQEVKRNRVDATFCLSPHMLDQWLDFFGHDRNDAIVPLVEVLDADVLSVRLQPKYEFITETFYEFKLAQWEDFKMKTPDLMAKRGCSKSH